MKHTFITRFLCSLFPYKVIENCDHDPYLVRWYVLRTKWVSLFIHKFIRSDEDRALHDHPWSFLVIPLWRGYIEHTSDPVQMGPFIASRQRRVYPILGTRYRHATFRHRVELLKGYRPLPVPSDLVEVTHIDSDGEPMLELPAWSLFFHFKREREWGFHLPEGFVYWRKFWEDKCE
jgi:hypothetical protein